MVFLRWNRSTLPRRSSTERWIGHFGRKERSEGRGQNSEVKTKQLWRAWDHCGCGGAIVKLSFWEEHHGETGFRSNEAADEELRFASASTLPFSSPDARSAHLGRAASSVEHLRCGQLSGSLRCAVARGIYRQARDCPG